MGRWRAGVDEGEEEEDLPVHIALEIQIFVSWQLQEKLFLLNFTQGLAPGDLCIWVVLTHALSVGLAEILSSPRTLKDLGAEG